MKFRNSLLAAAGLLLPFFAWAQPVAELPTLPERLFPQLDRILVEATQQSPRMVLMRLDQEIAHGDLMQSRSVLMPSVSGFFQLNQSRDQREDLVGTLTSDKSYYAFSLSQPIFHWGERLNTYRMGVISRNLATRQYKEGYRMLAQEIRSAYLQLIVGKVRLDIATFNLKQAEDVLLRTEDNVAKGVISDADAFQPRMNAEQSRLTYDQTVFSYGEAKRLFKVLTGVDAPADQTLPIEIPAVGDMGPQITGLLNGFLRQPEPVTFSGLNLKDQVASARLSYQIQKTRLLPKFNFIMGLSQDEQSYTTNLAAKYGLEQQYVGVSASWMLFDGFASRGARLSALARLRRAEASYQQYSEGVAASAQRSVRELEFAARNLHMQERMLNSYRAFIDFRRDQITRGLASATELIQAQQQYNAGLLATISARASYLQQVAEFIGLVTTDPIVDNLNLPTR